MPLQTYMNMGGLDDLAPFTSFPMDRMAERLAVIKEAGFDGVQCGPDEVGKARALGLGVAGDGRVKTAGEALPLAKKLADSGYPVATLHVGWGMEDDETLDRIIDAIYNAAESTGVAMHVETHRATVTQDPWRTVQMIKRHPRLTINADFSHWYTGLEMPYGNMEEKLTFMQPVMDRVRFMHGRIGNSGCIQVDIGVGRGLPHVEHFKRLWTAAMAGFLRNAPIGADLVFAPELLKPSINYARTFRGPDGKLGEEGDRWQQALLYVDLARECFSEAQKQVTR